MARKRGGLAGIWDRNKGVIKTALPAALSFIPGVGVPLAAAAGAAMEGLDRPGKSGIGLDLGGAVRGGISGYGIGSGTQAARAGIQGLLTARKLDSLSPVDMTSKIGMTPGRVPFATDQTAAFGLGGQVAPVDVSRLAANAPMFPSAATGASTAGRATAAAPRVLAPTASAAPASSFVAPLRGPSIAGPIGLPSSGTTGVPSNVPNAFGRFKDVVGEKGKTAAQRFRENKDIIEMVGKYTMPPRESATDRMKAETDRMQAETQRKYYEFQMQQATEQQQRDEARRRAILQFLSPYIQKNAPLLNPSAFGIEG